MPKTVYAPKGFSLRIVLPVALTLICGQMTVGQEAKIKLAVVGLSNPATLTKSNIGNALVDILDSEISAAGKYTLLERAELEELKKELNLAESDLADAKSFSQKGGLTGADFLLLGKVSDYTYKENTSWKTKYVVGAGIQRVAEYDHAGEVRVDIRLVDVRTGEAVRSVSGHGISHDTGQVSFQREWLFYVQTQGQGTLSNLTTLLTNASNSAIQDAVRKLNDMNTDLVAVRANRSISSAMSNIGDGKVLAALGQDQFVIGVANTGNLKVGDRFRVIAEVPTRNSQGVVVYRGKRDVGTLEVTDISETNRAMAKLIVTPGGGNPESKPKENDTVTFDQDYGKSLRGTAAASPVTKPLTSQPAVTGEAAGVETFLKRGDRSLAQQDYSEALSQYKEGLQVQPNNPELLSRKAVAEAGVNDLTDAEEDAEKAIAAGGWVEFTVFHNHAFGHCEGKLGVGKGKVAFRPTTGDDGFELTSKGQIAISESVYTRTNVPELVVNWHGQDGKGHKYYLVVLSYLTPISKTAGLPYQAEGDAVEKTKGLDGMIVRLINTSLP